MTLTLKGTLTLLLLVADSSSFGLRITHLTKVEPHSTSTKRVGFRLPSVLFKSSPESTNERVEAPPSLPQRTRAWCRRVRVAKEGTQLSVNLGFSELVEVPEELEVSYLVI